MNNTPFNLGGKGFSVVHLNARSIRNKFKERIKVELENKKLDVILFSETWLSNIDLDSEYQLEGYNLHRLDRARDKIAGGICAFTADHLTVSMQHLLCMNVSNKDIEMQWMQINKGKSKKALIINIYRPPDGSIPGFINALQLALCKIENLDQFEVIVTGDFNIDVTSESDDREMLYNLLDKFHMKQLISEPTRIAIRMVNGRPVKKETCIDLVFTNSVNVQKSGVANAHISDHLPVFVVLKHEHFKIPVSVFKGRSYRKYNKTEFENDFKGKDWTEFDECLDVNMCWEKYLQFINEILDRSCPIKEFRIRNRGQPWLTPELISRIAEKNKMLKTARKSNSIGHWMNANEAKNAVDRDLDIARKAHVVEQLREDGANAKRFWSMIKEIVPSKGTSSKQINLTDPLKGQIKIDDTAEYINTYFSEIGPTLARAHVSEWSFDGTECDEPMADMAIDTDEVIKIVKNLETCKSSGIDNVSTLVFRHAVLCYPEKFVRILKMSLENSLIPVKWKQAVVTPLPKGGDSSNVSNLRPIS